MAYLFAHLAVSRRHMYPIAIGRRPPDSLLRAIRLPLSRVFLPNATASKQNRSNLLGAFSPEKQVYELCNRLHQRLHRPTEADQVLEVVQSESVWTSRRPRRKRTNRLQDLGCCCLPGNH